MHISGDYPALRIFAFEWLLLDSDMDDLCRSPCAICGLVQFFEANVLTVPFGMMAEIPDVLVRQKGCCRLTETPPLSSQPPPPSVEFLQSLAGLVRLSPTPCRCSKQEHSRGAK